MQNMTRPEKLTFYVPCYIYLYLKKTYRLEGVDSIDASLPYNREIMSAFRYRDLTADMIEPPLMDKESFALIHLYVPQHLTKKYGGIVAHKDCICMRDSIFAQEFWLSAIAFTDGILAYRKAQGDHLKYRRQALRLFLDKYGIDEQVYPLYNAIRKLYKHLQQRNHPRHLPDEDIQPGPASGHRPAPPPADLPPPGQAQGNA